MVAAAYYDAVVLDLSQGTLRGYWPFDETSGTVAYDLSGNTANANLSGDYTQAVTPGPQQIASNRGALRANAASVGSYALARVPSSNGLQTAGALTIAGFVAIDEINRDVVVARNGAGLGYNYQLVLRMFASTATAVIGQHTGSANYQQAFTSFPITLGAWSLVVATRAANGLDWHIYCDGSLVGSHTFAEPGSGNDATVSMVSLTSSAQPGVGRLCRVAIYHRELAAGDVARLYAAAKATGLLARRRRAAMMGGV